MYSMFRVFLSTALFCTMVMLEAHGAQFHCRAVGLSGEGVTDRDDIETYAGFAEIRPENQFDLVIDTDDLTLTVKENVLDLANLNKVNISSGVGFSADIPTVAGKVLVRYRESDEFFALIMGGYTIAGNCPRM